LRLEKPCERRVLRTGALEIPTFMHIKKPILSIVEILVSPLLFFWFSCLTRFHSSRIPCEPIPRNIFQTWKSDNELTERQRAAQKSWREFNPGWGYSFYDDTRSEEFVKEFYSDYYKVWPILTPVERADLWRYLIVHKYGGVYADIDTVCLRSLDDVIDSEIDMVMFFETFKFEPPFVFPMWVQWFFGSTPNNPIMLEVCDEIVTRLSESPPVDWVKSRPGLKTLYVTGPFVWSKIINRIWRDSRSRKRIRIFWPVQILTWIRLRYSTKKQKNCRDRIFLRLLGRTPVVHYGQNSWRQ